MADARSDATWEEAVRWLRDQPGSARLVHDAYYDDPLEAAADRYWRSEEWADVRQLVGPASGRALDVGAGRGIASYALARDGFAVTAVEPDDSDLVGAGAIRRLAAETGLVIGIVADGGVPLPLADESFDLIFCRAVLHHLPDMAAALFDYHRLLRPGGTFVAIREHVVSRAADLPVFFAKHPLHHRYGGENAFPLATYTDAIRAAGFTLDRVVNPLERPVNYAPLGRDEICRGIGARLEPLPLLPALLTAALRMPLLHASLLRLIGRVDRRPGRHYSFVATRTGRP